MTLKRSTLHYTEVLSLTWDLLAAAAVLSETLLRVLLILFLGLLQGRLEVHLPQDGTANEDVRHTVQTTCWADATRQSGMDMYAAAGQTRTRLSSMPARCKMKSPVWSTQPDLRAER